MNQVQVNYSKEGKLNAFEIVVPVGTKIGDLAKIYTTIGKTLGDKFHPRGCGACLSGAHFVIREILDSAENVKY